MTSIEHYAQTLANLNQDNLSQLPLLLAEQVHFVDPFNDCRGIEAMMHVLTDMFEKLQGVRFEVQQIVENQNHGCVDWTFYAYSKITGQLAIRGVSRVTLDEQQLVSSHIDYWDASELLAQLPAMGPAVRWVKQKMSAS